MFFNRKKPTIIKKTKLELFREYSIRALFIIFGAFVTAAALETFLLPNNIIDGGVIGISMMVHYVTGCNLGLAIFCINFPFVLLAYKKLGRKFVLQTFFAITMLSIATNVFHGFKVTEDLLLSTVFGGIILGFGVGLILRNNASLDGTEMVSILISKKLKVISVGELLMIINLFIYISTVLKTK